MRAPPHTVYVPGTLHECLYIREKKSRYEMAYAWTVPLMNLHRCANVEEEGPRWRMSHGAAPTS